MAIAPTGAIYKSLVFDGEDSRNYGVYITGEAVYNAPGRDVEMVEIPGRNGSFALDKGRFQNIEVSYPAGIFADNEADFAEAISDFRNFLCSRRGYVRLTDEYNPNEYRMAIYKSGLEVSPAQLKAGEFEIVFDCKPQRWLTSGEAAVTVSSGGTINNPTLFEASPLLEVEGYGTIGFNGYEIEYAGDPYGEVVLASETWAFSADNPYTKRFLLGTSLLNVGDAIYSKAERYLDGYFLVRPSLSASREFTNLSVGTTTNVAEARIGSASNSDIFLYVYIDAGSFVYGTTKTISSSASFNYAVENGPIYTEQVQATIAYDGADAITVTTTRTGTVSAEAQRGSSQALMPTMYGNSSKTASGPIFIDCDLGEAYVIENDVYISMNHYIDLGSDLPKLASSSNTVTFDNTITKLKVTPRWWKV